MVTKDEDSVFYSKQLPDIKNMPDWLLDDGTIDRELTAEIEEAASMSVSG